MPDTAFDADAYYQVAYRPHAIMNPLGVDRLRMLARETGRALSLRSRTTRPRVLDIGSGKGHAALVFAEEWNAHTVQVDISAEWLAQAGTLFDAHGRREQAEFHCTDAASFVPEKAGCDAVLCLGTALVFGGFAEALQRLRPALREGGVLIAGEPSADRPLPRAYASYLSRTGWDVGPSERLLRTIETQGFDLLFCLRSTADEWDTYMGLQWCAVADHARANPGDAQARAFHDWARDEQEVYLRYQRHFVDWNVFALRAV
jgi:SAM-dependent methyltransferase